VPLARAVERIGRFEIYVQPYAGPGGKVRISANGGAQPRWNKNGKEIFYLSLDSRMMTAPVKLSPDRQSLETSTPAAPCSRSALPAVPCPAHISSKTPCLPMANGSGQSRRGRRYGLSDYADLQLETQALIWTTLTASA